MGAVAGGASGLFRRFVGTAGSGADDGGGRAFVEGAVEPSCGFCPQSRPSLRFPFSNPACCTNSAPSALVGVGWLYGRPGGKAADTGSYGGELYGFAQYDVVAASPHAKRNHDTGRRPRLDSRKNRTHRKADRSRVGPLLDSRRAWLHG